MSIEEKKSGLRQEKTESSLILNAVVLIVATVRF